eukprot:c19433_g1_i2 orf=137-505(+)
MGSARFPVRCLQLSTDIRGNSTDVILCAYDDFIFVMATQLGRMGTLLHARKEEVFGSVPTFNVNVVLGKRDEPTLVACARQLIEDMSNSGSSRQLLLSLGLKDHSAETLKEVFAVLSSNKVW